MGKSCCNPVFYNWIKESRDKAKENENQAYYTYNKAMKALIQYPIPLRSGTEAMIIKNIGPKLGKMLDKKCKEYYKGEGYKDDVIDHFMTDCPLNELPPVIDRLKDESSSRKRRKVNTASTSSRSDEKLLSEMRELTGVTVNTATVNTATVNTVTVNTATVNSATVNKNYHNSDNKGGEKRSPRKKRKSSKGKERAPRSDYSHISPERSSSSAQVSDQMFEKSVFGGEEIVISDEEEEKHQTGPEELIPGKFYYTYVDDNGLESRMRRDAAYMENADLTGLWMLAKCYVGTIEKSSKLFLECDKYPSTDTLRYVYIESKDCDIRAPGLPQRTPENNSEEEDKEWEIKQSLSLIIDGEVVSRVSNTTTTRSLNVITSLVGGNTDVTTPPPTSPPQPVTSPTVLTPPPPLFTLTPGSFRVVLCVDNCEVNTPRQQQIITELKRNKTNFDVRKLQIGDFMWVAQTSDGRELVLDCVVERKRLDDLASSITGGRFTEQKMRLKKCGLSRTVYLVESKSSYISLPETTLHQALVNTQVIDGFVVKRTKDTKETIAYLSLTTTLIEQKYNFPLHAVDDPLNVSKDHLLTFSTFSKHSVKNKVYSTRETFLKQLTRIPKVSQTKAESLVCHYPTVCHLITALSNSEEPEKLCEGIKYGVGQRKFGIAVSRSIAQFYSTPSALH